MKKALTVIFFWLVAVALVYIVYIKAKMLFN